MKQNWQNSKIVVKGFILYLLFLAHFAFSGTTEAWTKYKAGDLQNAKREARSAVQTSRTPGAKSEALKILGLIEYALGEKDQAKIHFAEAKGLSKSIRVDSKDAFDPSVIPFFNSIQPAPTASRPPQKVTANPSASAAKKPAQRPNISITKPAVVGNIQNPAAKKTLTVQPNINRFPAPKTTAVPQPKTFAAKPLSSAPAKVAPRKGTYLQVICNVKSASLSIDGILAGSANDLITVKPGKIVFEVSAAGYRTSRVTTFATANTTTKVNVTLKEIAPPKQPSPPKSNIANKAQNPRNSKPASPPPKTRDMFGEEIPLYPSSGPTSGTAYQPAPNLPVRPSPHVQQPNPQYGNSPGNLPNQNYGQVPPGSYPTGPQAPYYQQYPGQPYPGQPYTGQPYPGQPYPPQGLGYPMPYQQPIITVVPIYPNQDSNPMPPAPTFPALDPYAAMPPPVEAPAPNPFIETPDDSSYKSSFDSKPSSKLRKKKKSKKKSTISFVYAILPFGGPQFIGGKPVLGAIFGASQAGAIYYWYKSSNDAKTALADGTAEIARREAEAGSAPDPQAYQDDTDAYKKTLSAYIKDKDNTATLSLVGFGALWALSFLESMIFGPAPPPVSTSDLTEEFTDRVATQPEAHPVQFHLYPEKEGMSLGVSWKF
jgi:hypothetical protein